MTDRSCIFCDTITHKERPTYITELDNSVVLLNYDQEHYPGRVLVVLKTHETDMLMLPKILRDDLNDDVMLAAGAIKKLYKADRMNYCNLGNEVEHIHWHIIPRYKGDINWGRPPWPVDTPEHLPDEEYRKIAEKIREMLQP